jgi:alpha-tubulin suppressor-like RCC1 family protein
LGLHHAAAINSNGDLFTWGHGFFGQLGHGDNTTLKLPKKVEMGELKIEKIKCGTYYTLAVDRREMPYICGKALLNLSSDKNKNKLELV